MALLLTTLGAVPLLWPADAPWINDEPRLIDLAVQCKNSGRIVATHGLMGSRGFVYGPFPTWIYTALVSISNDLVKIVRLRAAIVTFLTIVAIAWLARLCPNLYPPWGALALLSPYVWLYSRELWDNTFLIPLSALTVAAYLSFSARPAFWKLWIVVLGLVFMFLTHLMSIDLIVPILIHGILFHRTWFRANGREFALPLAVVVGLSGCYVYTFVTHVAAPVVRMSDLSPSSGWIFPWIGGKFFSSYGIDYFFGDRWYVSEFLKSARWVRFLSAFTFLALPVVWLGMWMSAKMVWKAFRYNMPRSSEVHLSLLSLAAVAVQCVLDGFLRLYGHPHYFNATWICFFYFFWTAFSSPAPSRPIRFLAGLFRGGYIISMAVVLGFLILNMHASQGNEEIHYGSALGQQIEIARKVHQFNPQSPLQLDVPQFVLFPHALPTIMYFYGLTGTETGPLAQLQVRPVKGGWLMLEETPYSPFSK